MTTRLYSSLVEKNKSTTYRAYRFLLSNQNKRLRIELYDRANPPKKYHNKRIAQERLEEIARETFTDIDFSCGTCADSGVRIDFKPKSTSRYSQKYFGHNICIDENTALIMIIQTGNDPRTLHSSQREHYESYIHKIMQEYLSNGIKRPK